MIEVIKHTLGVCGEGHPHLLSVTPILVGVLGYYYYLKQKVKKVCKKIWYHCMTIWGMQQEEL